MQAGLAIVREKGDEALNLRAAALRAGLSEAIAYQLKGLTHDAAGNRRDVRRTFLAAIAEHGFEELHKHMLTASEVGTPDVTDLALVYVRFAQRNPGLYRVMFRSELGDRKDYQDLGTIIGLIYGRFRSALSRKQEQEKALHARTMALVLLLHGFSSELINDWIPNAESEEKVRRMTRDYVKLLL